jgi:hypothetical protein
MTCIAATLSALCEAWGLSIADFGLAIADLKHPSGLESPDKLILVAQARKPGSS